MFLLVFAVVNGAALWHRVLPGWRVVLPLAGGVGCLAAAVALAVQTGVEEPLTLAAIGGVAAVLMVLRGLFRWVHFLRPEGGGRGEDGG